MPSTATSGAGPISPWENQTSESVTPKTSETLKLRRFKWLKKRNVSDVMRYVGNIGITPFQIGKTGKWAKSVTLKRNVTLFCAYVDMTKI